MTLTERLLTKNECYLEGRALRPRGVMVHSTGVAQPDPNVFLKSWNRAKVYKCVHAFVHEGGVIQTLPWDIRGWHAGTGTSGKSANDTHIAFEICEPKGHTYQGGEMVGYDPEKNKRYFTAVYDHAVELTAMLCGQFGLDPMKDGVVLCHSEGYTRGIASNHSDVTQWFPRHGKSMDDFRRDVAARMKGEDDMTREETQALIDQAVGALKAELTPEVYHTLEEVPDWGKATVAALMKSGRLKGDEKGDLALTHDLLRALVVMERGERA